MTRASLVVATSLLGLSAGLFATFVQSMRAINIAILNPVFAIVFAGRPRQRAEAACAAR